MWVQDLPGQHGGLLLPQVQTVIPNFFIKGAMTQSAVSLSVRLPVLPLEQIPW